MKEEGGLGRGGEWGGEGRGGGGTGEREGAGKDLGVRLQIERPPPALLPVVPPRPRLPLGDQPVPAAAAAAVHSCLPSHPPFPGTARWKTASKAPKGLITIKWSAAARPLGAGRARARSWRGMEKTVTLTGGRAGGRTDGGTGGERRLRKAWFTLFGFPPPPAAPPSGGCSCEPARAATSCRRNHATRRLRPRPPPPATSFSRERQGVRECAGGAGTAGGGAASAPRPKGEQQGGRAADSGQ